MINNIKNLLNQRLNVSGYSICAQQLVGFIEAEGSFCVGPVEQASFSLSQHTTDVRLIQAIANFIGFGNPRSRVEKDGTTMTYLVIYDQYILEHVIIPLCLGNLRTSLNLLNSI